jgi:acetyl esterase/lipase
VAELGLTQPSVFHSAPASPILIYLPSGPVLPDHAEEEERIISTLAASSGATIARISYRASTSHQFPAPVHDVLLGYDWVKENLLQDGSSRPKLARMGVCGQLMGGSLAVTLALTECRNAETRIGAAAVNNPIADWVFPDDLPAVPASELHEPFRPEETAFPADEDPMSPDLSTKEVAAIDIIGNEAATHSTRKHPKRVPKPPPPTAWQLHGDNTIIPTCQLSAERDMLFRIPEHYFDRFASPIHFFRSPHGILISPEDDDKFASEQPDVPLDFETQLDIDHFVELHKSAQATSAPELPTLARCRAYARIYPPAGPNLVLPVWHITTGSTSPLLDQGTELTKMIKRSIARQTLKRRAGRSRWHDATEKQYYEEYADSRVQVDPVDGIGLWTQQDGRSDWKAQVERVGAFMKQSLSPQFV